MTLSELEACFKIVLSRARDRGIVTLDPGEKDLYWTVGSSDWLKPYEEPKPSVGSFADDEAELMKILQNPWRISAVDVERVANLTRLLSELVAGTDL